jgi:hypothetical protein
MDPNFAYQIEFNALAAGKTIAMSKRRLRWRFGFPNQEALANGETGTSCRGEEHDITIVWSVQSGKRMIMANNIQVYQAIDRSSYFEHSWVMKGNHVIKVVAFANNTSTVGKQYDLLVDGHSFFNLPKTFELGLKGAAKGMKRIPGVYDYSKGGATPTTTRTSGRSYDVISPPHTAKEEQDNIKLAIQASLRESQSHLESRGQQFNNSGNEQKAAPPAPVPAQVGARPSTAPTVANAEVNLIDFFDAPANSTMSVIAPPPTSTMMSAATPPFPPSTMSAATPPLPPSTMSAATPPLPPSSMSIGTAPMYQGATVPVNTTVPGRQISAMSDPFAPAPTEQHHDAFTPQPPTYNDISSQIMQSYSQASAHSQQTPGQAQSHPHTVPGQIAVVSPVSSAQTSVQMRPAIQNQGYNNYAAPGAQQQFPTY